MSALLEFLDHCARRVPLYRDVAPPTPAETPTAALARFPVLRRPQLLRAPRPRDLDGARRDALDAEGDLAARVAREVRREHVLGELARDEGRHAVWKL